MKNYQKCCQRDSNLVAEIERHKVLSTEQIRLLKFKEQLCGERIAQRRLAKLTKQKRVYRDRYSVNEPYFYWTDKKPKQVEHSLGVNWAYIWLCNGCRSNWQITHWEREPVYNAMRPDAFCVKRSIVGVHSFYFVEMDIAESGNEFRKVSQYNNLYESGECSGQWWWRYASLFPNILIVTTGRKERILKRIERENRNALDFVVKTLDEVKGECMA